MFVLGHWRSGTTLLHNLLTLDPQFTYPNLYQVLYSGHFLTTQRWVAPLTQWMLPKTRIVDNMPADWNMTQEDEIALLLTTGMSPYLMLLFQDDRSRYERYFSLSRLSPQELAIWKKSLLLFLKKMTYQHRRQIVLKSPGHTYRIPLLLKMFPGAKFIYIGYTIHTAPAPHPVCRERSCRTAFGWVGRRQLPYLRRLRADLRANEVADPSRATARSEI